jgi:hypothetical protein
MELVGTPTVRAINVMKKMNMIAVTIPDSKYSRQTLFGGPMRGFSSSLIRLEVFEPVTALSSESEGEDFVG